MEEKGYDSWTFTEYFRKQMALENIPLHTHMQRKQEDNQMEL